jgi:hypothetical protein
MFPKKLVLGEMQKKTQVLCYQALAFLSISKNRDLFAFQSALCGGETCNRYTERRA